MIIEFFWTDPNCRKKLSSKIIHFRVSSVDIKLINKKLFVISLVTKKMLEDRFTIKKLKSSNLSIKRISTKCIDYSKVVFMLIKGEVRSSNG